MLAAESPRRSDAVRQHRNAAYVWTVYSLGLRLNEGLHLQVGDLDSRRCHPIFSRSHGDTEKTVQGEAKTRERKHPPSCFRYVPKEER
jgi:site-specific recombinase XerD